MHFLILYIPQISVLQIYAHGTHFHGTRSHEKVKDKMKIRIDQKMGVA